MRTEIVVVGRGYLAARTERAVAEPRRARDLQAALTSARPTWILCAGAVPDPARPSLRPSDTGKPLIALGATVGDEEWTSLLARTGGEIDRIPSVASAYVERPHELAELALREGTLEAACERALRDGKARVVRVPALDVAWDARLRVVEVVTTAHRGGAERIAIDLARGLDAPLVVLDRATRATYEVPEGTVFLAGTHATRGGRIDALVAFARERRADVIHAHLLDGDELDALSRCGIPVVTTIHNARAGWPARLDVAVDLDLSIACARDVARDLEGRPHPVRTIWNAVTPPDVAPAETEGLVLLSIANHRPQKRLERIPAIVAELRARGHDARAILAGEPVRNDEIALAIAERVRAEAERAGVAEHVRLVGTQEDVAPLLAQASVAISTSAFEGLSLFHLEALGARVPLVTTRVSGADELARKHLHVHVVDVDAHARDFADAVLAARSGPRSTLAPDFTVTKMIERHRDLLAQVAARTSRVRGGIVLVTNNFATGGAQSSARRLLLELAASGVAVEAVVIEEQAAHPTPGRSALEAAGVRVHAAPRAGLVDPIVTARAVADVVDDAAPSAVLFWNVIPEHKILVADLLVGVRVWDVSPGEMFFASLERYFRAPRAGLPYLTARDYGSILAGAVVKYEAERTRAEEALRTPVHVVHNGVDVPSYVERPRRDRVVVGTLARISPDKKLEELVDAASPELDVRIAGGVERGCEAYAAALRDRSRHVTWVGERDSRAFLAECDLFAMVSEPAGCPNASLEAMAASLAVVATDGGGARDQIVHGETGLLVPRGDSRAFEEALLALANDPARREAMGRAAHTRARERFTVERMARDYARICLDRDLDDARLAAE